MEGKKRQLFRTKGVTVMVRVRVARSRLTTPVVGEELAKDKSQIKYPHTVITLAGPEVIAPSDGVLRPEDLFVQKQFNRIRNGRFKGNLVFTKRTALSKSGSLGVLVLVRPDGTRTEPREMTSELPRGTEVILVLRVIRNKQEKITGVALQHVIAKQEVPAA